MKNGIALLVASMLLFSAAAQPGGGGPARIGPGAEPFSMAFESILHDFPDNLQHITGELVLAEGETENYACKVALPGAEHCVITRYHSREDTTASWQARMYSNTDFEKASSVYHAMYRKLEGCYLLLADSSLLYLKGEWEPARGGMPFTTSTLRFTTGDWRFRELQVQVELAYLEENWVVSINIFHTPLEPASGS